MKRLVSGIKPTGDLTLGNYIGAIKNFVKLQNEYESYIFVADLHALTTGKVNSKEFKEQRESIVALYAACGLDFHKNAIFYQSQILEHSQMQWLALCQTTLGELKRMTQFKDQASKLKQGNGTEKIPTGILTYPTLMAGDILLYNPDVVPVGEDQIQHLELTRNIAQRFNKNYQTNLKIPQAIVPKVGAKIKSLNDPNVKMSKSQKNPKSTIYLLEDPESAYKKVLKAVTDSENKIYLSESKPGILNLLNIYAGINDLSLEQAAEIFRDSNYKDFKEAVAKTVKDLLVQIQTKYQYYLKNVDAIISVGAQKAQLLAKQTINNLQLKIGLYGENDESK